MDIYYKMLLFLGDYSLVYTNHEKNVEYFQWMRTGYIMLLTGIVDGEYQYLHKRIKKELIYCCNL